MPVFRVHRGSSVRGETTTPALQCSQVKTSGTARLTHLWCHATVNHPPSLTCAKQRHCSTGLVKRTRQKYNPGSHRRRKQHICEASQAVGVFPAGQKQARVDLPAIMVQVDAQSVLDSPDLLDSINAAITAGATAVVLGDSQAGAAALYEAAVRLKELLRDRAALLLVDRTDIATAVSAEGVVLSESGKDTLSLGWKVLQGMTHSV